MIAVSKYEEAVISKHLLLNAQPAFASISVVTDSPRRHDQQAHPEHSFTSLPQVLDITPHARIKLSVYPANSVCPSALHDKLTHSGSRLFLPTALYSGFSSSTLLFFSRSKTTIMLEVAAHNQYRFGEKTRAWISSPAGSEYRCFDSLRSQSMVTPSLPPDAHSDPSGEMVTVLI